MAWKIPAGQLKAVIWALILAGLVLGAGALWSGAKTLLADRRIRAAGLTETARVVSLTRPAKTQGTGRVGLGWVRYELHRRPGVLHGLEISRDTWSGLRVGQTITIIVDPDNPDSHQFDRSQQIRLAWAFLALGLVLVPIRLGLTVWALRGGMTGLWIKG